MIDHSGKTTKRKNKPNASLDISLVLLSEVAGYVMEGEEQMVSSGDGGGQTDLGLVAPGWRRVVMQHRAAELARHAGATVHHLGLANAR